MAGALRPAVLLMAIASLLFFLAGWLDGIYPDGPSWSLEAYGGLGWTSYLFGFVNAVVAVLIARGSERILALRIGLAAFFMIERTVTAFYPTPKALDSFSVHLLTAVLEAVILLTTMRVWRLGHAVTQTDLSLLTFPTSAPMPLAAAAAGASLQTSSIASALAGIPASGRRSLLRIGFGRRMAPKPVPAVEEAEAQPRRTSMAERVAPLVPPRATWTIGLLALGLAAALVADAAVAGIVPGVAVDVASPHWFAYLFALVLLAVATRAVHGSRYALRLLLALSLVQFLERSFTPFALRIEDPASLGLHLTGAFVALALALASAAALRSTGPRRPRPIAIK